MHGTLVPPYCSWSLYLIKPAHSRHVKHISCTSLQRANFVLVTRSFSLPLPNPPFSHFISHSLAPVVIYFTSRPRASWQLAPPILPPFCNPLWLDYSSLKLSLRMLGWREVCILLAIYHTVAVIRSNGSICDVSAWHCDFTISCGRHFLPRVGGPVVGAGTAFLPPTKPK